MMAELVIPPPPEPRRDVMAAPEAGVPDHIVDAVVEVVGDGRYVTAEWVRHIIVRRGACGCRYYGGCCDDEPVLCDYWKARRGLTEAEKNAEKYRRWAAERAAAIEAEWGAPATVSEDATEPHGVRLDIEFLNGREEVYFFDDACGSLTMCRWKLTCHELVIMDHNIVDRIVFPREQIFRFTVSRITMSGTRVWRETCRRKDNGG